MAAAIQVTEAMIAREFRLQRCRGSAMEALSNDPLRRVLELRARIRAEHEQAAPMVKARDAKSRAANDND